MVLQCLQAGVFIYRRRILSVEGVNTLLSSMVSSAAASSAISMITTPGLPQYGAAIVVGLIALLSLKEVLSASEKWNKYLNNSFNVAILPLLFSFILIVAFKVEHILWLQFLQSILFTFYSFKVLVIFIFFERFLSGNLFNLWLFFSEFFAWRFSFEGETSWVITFSCELLLPVQYG